MVLQLLAVRRKRSTRRRQFLPSQLLLTLQTLNYGNSKALTPRSQFAWLKTPTFYFRKPFHGTDFISPIIMFFMYTAVTLRGKCWYKDHQKQWCNYLKRFCFNTAITLTLLILKWKMKLLLSRFMSRGERPQKDQVLKGPILDFFFFFFKSLLAFKVISNFPKAFLTS